MNARQANLPPFPIIALILAILVLIFVLPAALFKVDEAEQAVILQFGKPVGKSITTPGLKFKMPFVQEVRRFDKRILEWDDPPTQIPTGDRQIITVNTAARWRISDPLKFLQAVKTIRVAESRIGDAIKSAVRDDISRNALKEAVLSQDLKVSQEELEELEGSTSGDDGDNKGLVISVKVGREAITRSILLKASEQVKEFGIELIDVRLKRLNYNPDVRPQVYERMVSERERIATMFRSEGKKQSDIIRGQVQKSVDIISSQAKREAEEIRGEAQGEATKIYNDAYGVDPEFYAFFRSMEAYGDAVGSGSTLILKSDSDFFKYLREISPDGPIPKGVPAKPAPAKVIPLKADAAVEAEADPVE